MDLGILAAAWLWIDRYVNCLLVPDAADHEEFLQLLDRSYSVIVFCGVSVIYHVVFVLLIS